MWYVFDTDLTWRGVMSETNLVEIEHSFHEADVLVFTAPFSKELYETLKIGYILYRKNQTKGFRIHTIEVNEAERSIIGSCYGLEGILSQRIVNVPADSMSTAEATMKELVRVHLIDTDSARKINMLRIDETAHSNIPLDASYYGESLYTIISELSKSHGIGYRFNFYPMNREIVFETYLPADRTSLQGVHDPVIWRSSWGDTRDEMFLLSEKDYKNVVYLESGDYEKPVRTSVGNASGWNRHEMFSQATDIQKNMKEDIVLSDSEIVKLLKTRGNLELYRNYKINDFSFVLNNGIQQVFGKDFQVGDKVSVVHEGYGITRHAVITSVRETIIQGRSQFEIKFDEGGSI